jgi:hypothetical protein
MEMAGKHSDHYFRKWQKKIVNKINFNFGKKWKNKLGLSCAKLSSS